MEARQKSIYSDPYLIDKETEEQSGHSSKLAFAKGKTFVNSNI